MTIDEAVELAQQKLAEFREALAALGTELTAEFGHESTAVVSLKERASAISFDGVRRTIAEVRRPKGPMVTLEWTGREKKHVQVEVVRRTATQVIIRNGFGEERYRLNNGSPVEGPRPWLSNWRIRESDLATIRAMPVSENEVSMALKEIGK